MKRKSVKIAACTMAAVIAFSGIRLTADASGDLNSVLPSAGINYYLSPSDKSTSLSDIKEDVERASSSGLTASTEETGVKGQEEIPVDGSATDDNQPKISNKKIEDIIVLSEGYTKDLKEASNAEKYSDEEEGFKNLVIAQVRSYVNVRDIPSEEGNIVGKLYNKSVGTFIEEVDGWYKISSGSVEGYVKGEFCVTGDEAVELAKEVGTRIATVTTTTLFVREAPSLDAPKLGMVP
ncbi:MAG: SH3 domain-containing protein, partial [Lachnospiraceae bacterium]|nr:SH3 domain-containing protein [Lachnospiraceae bacterium]